MAGGSELVWVMVGGAVRDPVLWVLGAVVGWDHRRAARATANLLALAGVVWGAVRVGVYTALGESLGVAGAVLMVAVCVVLMVGLGFAVRAARRQFGGG